MAYNRKMRKFEGTCYIPGEQLAMMAKYYRGANLNLNLTLFEDDLASMQETLDQACWCSKLDEVDRMKMQHMKGNEWRIQHDHCQEQGQGGRNVTAYPALPQRSKSAIGKVERGTSAISVGDPGRGRGARFQRDNYDSRNGRDDYNYDDNYRGGKYHYPRQRQDDYSNAHSNRNYEMRNQFVDPPAPPNYPDARPQFGRIPGDNMRAPPPRRQDWESEVAASSLPEGHGDIRCAVCNVETCLVCKNHLYSEICRCKCPVANAGLCTRCTQEPCEDSEDQAVQETREKKMDMSSLMLTMMMQSMFKQSQAPGMECCCKASKCSSESLSSDSCEERVHKVYLYDCDGSKKSKISKKNAPSGSSDSACDCCKCPGKPKKGPAKKAKGPKRTKDDTEDESNGGQKKNQSTKGKGSRDSNKKSRGADSDSGSEPEAKGSKQETKSSKVNQKPLKISKEDDAQSVRASKEGNRKSNESKKDNRSSIRSSEVQPREDQVEGSVKSRNVHFPYDTSPSRNSPDSSGSEDPQFADRSRQGKSETKSKPEVKLVSDSAYSHTNIPNHGSPNGTTKNGSLEGVAEESSSVFNLRDFIVCLPKIQSNLQNLLSKLDQMDVFNGKLQYSGFDPMVTNTQPLITGMQSSQDAPPIFTPRLQGATSLAKHPRNATSMQGGSRNAQEEIFTPTQEQDSRMSIGFPPELPTAISPRPSKEEPNVSHQSSQPNRYASILQLISSGQSHKTHLTPTPMRQQSNRVAESADSSRKSEPIKRTQSRINYSPFSEGQRVKCSIGKDENVWSFGGQSHLIPAPSIIFPSNNLPRASNLAGNSRRDHRNGNSSGEVIQLPKGETFKERHNESKQSKGQKVDTITTTATSRCEGETMFQSYKQSAADWSDQNLTDYGSFTDEKHQLLSPALSTQNIPSFQNGNMLENTKSCRDPTLSCVNDDIEYHTIVSKCQRQKPEKRKQKSRSVLKAYKVVKLKHRKPLTINNQKIVQRRFLQGSGRNSCLGMSAACNSRNLNELPEQGVGPGIFRHSKPENVDLNNGIPMKNIIPPNISGGIILDNQTTPDGRNKKQKSALTTAVEDHGESIKKKRSNSPPREKAGHSVYISEVVGPVNKKDRTVEPISLGKFGKQIISEAANTLQCSKSIFPMSNSCLGQQTASQSFLVSSVEVKAMNEDGSSANLFQMVQELSSKSIINVTTKSSELPPTALLSSDDFDIIPLLPLSSTTPASVSQSGLTKNQASLEDQSSNTPVFLKKSRVQVEQLKRAHETIRSMIKNVNDVIAHIDSDSKIGLKAKIRSEDRERQSYFVQFDDYKKNSSTQSKFVETKSMPKSGGFHSAYQEANSSGTSSEQSSGNGAVHWPSEGTTTSSRVRRDFFVLDSESTSTAFTESLRRSLENETSRSVPLATHPHMNHPQRNTSQRSRPLKRRSWFPPPK